MTRRNADDTLHIVQLADGCTHAKTFFTFYILYTVFNLRLHTRTLFLTSE